MHRGAFIAQVDCKFVLATAAATIGVGARAAATVYVIDQHAADERIALEQLEAQQLSGHVHMHSLVPPLRLELSKVLSMGCWVWWMGCNAVMGCNAAM